MKNLIKKLFNTLSVIMVLCVLICCFAGCNEFNDDIQENTDPVVLELQKSYSAIDDFENIIIANSEDIFGNDKAKEAIAQNDSIKAFLQEDVANNGLAQHLYNAGLSGGQILKLYKLCNKTSWYAGLLITVSSDKVVPLYFLDYFTYLPNATYIADEIRRYFKDPQSVTVEGAIRFYYNQDDVDKAIGSGASYVSRIRVLIHTQVRATNGFGAYITQGYYLNYVYPINLFEVYLQSDTYRSSVGTTMGTYTLCATVY